MRSRNRVPRWLATLVVVLVAIGLIAVGYLAAVRGWVQIGRNNSPSPTPIALVDVIDRVQSSAVTIDVTTLDGSFVGSGFVSASGGVILTNAHVVVGLSTLKIVFDDGTTQIRRNVNVCGVEKYAITFR